MRRRWLVAAVTLPATGAVIAAIAATVTRRTPPAPADRAIPVIDMTEMQVPVAELLASARDAVERDPASAAAWGRLGEVLDAHHLYEPAAECYARAAELDPAAFRWPYFHAIAGHYCGASLEETVERLHAAARLRPDYAPLYVRLGDTLAHCGRAAEAAEAYRAALRLAPRFPTAHRGLGQAMLALGDAEAAVGHLEDACRILDGDRATYVTLANASRRLGRRDDAIAYARRAAQLDSLYGYFDAVRGEIGVLGVSSSVALDRARFHLRTGDYHAAIADLELVLRVTPQDEWVRRQLAVAREAVGGMGGEP